MNCHIIISFHDFRISFNIIIVLINLIINITTNKRYFVICSSKQFFNTLKDTILQVISIINFNIFKFLEFHYDKSFLARCNRCNASAILSSFIGFLYILTAALIISGLPEFPLPVAKLLISPLLYALYSTFFSIQTISITAMNLA